MAFGNAQSDEVFAYNIHQWIHFRAASSHLQVLAFIEVGKIRALHRPESAEFKQNLQLSATSFSLSFSAGKTRSYGAEIAWNVWSFKTIYIAAKQQHNK